MLVPPKLVCRACGRSPDMVVPRFRCTSCGGAQEFEYDYEGLKQVSLKGGLSFWRYAPYLPQVHERISMGEGGTPIHEARRIGQWLGLSKLFLKDESRNPTNSFRDRCATLMVSNALDLKFESVIAATTGNLGASLAAYCAKGNLSCSLLVPREADMGKLAQMIAYDASVETQGETIDDNVLAVGIRAEELGGYEATFETNALGIEAVKTIAYEIVEQIGVPDWIVAPMGTGGTIRALWKGVTDLDTLGKIETMPRLIGVQAAGCSPIVQAFASQSLDVPEAVEARTSALAIRVRRPVYGSLALESLRESNGLAVSVSDEEIARTEHHLAHMEGMFAEPASSAALACLAGLREHGVIGTNDTIVCVITSSGLKTTDIVTALRRRVKSPGTGNFLATKERILRLVQDSGTYGYQIWKSMGKDVTLGAVYQHLSELERKDFIEAWKKGNRRYLTLTKKGQDILATLDELRNLLS